ncbi:MAG TPA: hypothetical protein IAB12_02240 [Candidatus Ornithospirochaeta avicola]|uniref:LPS export ABC transporter periplasmic protein LptC n=1 Tax=Candidatus Ornithospirochaeta avicola TaxID=2840896 RepID=A0A9D1PS63_9SPIO|nr:hypothetical protein [Candidatus Ornithospirochaeta avicola]
MKRFSLLLLLFLCCSFLFSVSISDAQKAISASLDASFSALSSSLSSPPVRLQGVTVSQSGGMPFFILFTRSDLSTYKESLSFRYSGNEEWLKILFNISSESSLSASVEHLQGYEKGAVIIDGTIYIVDDGSLEYSQLFENGDYSSVHIPLSVSLILTGSAFSESVLIEGDFLIYGSSSHLYVENRRLEINKEEISDADFTLFY